MEIKDMIKIAKDRRVLSTLMMKLMFEWGKYRILSAH